MYLCACIPAEYNILPTSTLPVCRAETDTTHHLATKQEKKISILTGDLILADFASYLLCLLDQRMNPQIKRMS